MAPIWAPSWLDFGIVLRLKFDTNSYRILDAVLGWILGAPGSPRARKVWFYLKKIEVFKGRPFRPRATLCSILGSKRVPKGSRNVSQNRQKMYLKIDAKKYEKKSPERSQNGPQKALKRTPKTDTKTEPKTDTHKNHMPRSRRAVGALLARVWRLGASTLFIENVGFSLAGASVSQSGANVVLRGAPSILRKRSIRSKRQCKHCRYY